MLIACEGCRRHFSIRELQCPFCKHGSALARLGAAALSAGVLLSGCDAGKDSKKPEQQQGSAVVVDKVGWATLHGTVTSRDGKPLERAAVSVTKVEQEQFKSFSKSIATDAAGHYTLDYLEPGAYMLNINYSQYANGMDRYANDTRQILLEPGEDSKLDVGVDVRENAVAPPYGAPPARRRVV